jgi:hypothetical protein
MISLLPLVDGPPVGALNPELHGLVGVFTLVTKKLGCSIFFFLFLSPVRLTVRVEEPRLPPPPPTTKSDFFDSTAR